MNTTCKLNLFPIFQEQTLDTCLTMTRRQKQRALPSQKGTEEYSAEYKHDWPHYP